MNKKELIKVMAENANLTLEQAAQALDGFEWAVGSTLLDGGTVKIVNFGTFKANPQPERTARNPATGESVIVPAHKRVAFIAGKGLKELVNLTE